MRFLPILLCLAILGGPAAASAAKVAGPIARVRLLECAPEKGSVKFQGEIRTLAKAASYQMRFALETRTATQSGWIRVAGVWTEWLTRAEAFIYDREVSELVSGDYRAVVRYRWRTTKGRILASATRQSRACRQPDERANLKPLKVTVGPGSEDDTRFYSVRVVNEGGAPAPPFSASIDVAGAIPPEESTGEPLPAGVEEVFAFEAPVCRAGSTITATVDAGAAVDESDETDNVLSVPCPGRAGTT